MKVKFTMRMKTVRTVSKILGALLGAGLLTITSFAQADEVFTQDGQNYVLKSGVVGVIRKPSADFDKPSSANKQSFAASASQKKQKTFFDVYDAGQLKLNPNKVAQKKKYRVVYKQVMNLKTKEITEVPALLTGNVIVQASDVANVNTSLKLKKSFKENGFYVYELADDAGVAKSLEELSKQPGVSKARVEILSHPRKPL